MYNFEFELELNLLSFVQNIQQNTNYVSNNGFGTVNFVVINN